MAETWWVGQDELNDEQKQVISLPLGNDYFIQGPPGSGKTNLLLLRANYMFLAGQKNILILVYTKTLREFIVSGASQYAFPQDKVKTQMKWQQDFLYEYGKDNKTPPGVNDLLSKRKHYIEEINKLIDSSNLEDVYDSILLDEAQDYFPEEINVFRRLAKNLFVVADSRQRIYNVDGAIQLLKKIIKKQFPLHHHYRSGRKICKLADAIAKDSSDYQKLFPTCNYNEKSKPSSVDAIVCKDIEDQIDKVIQALPVQLKAYPDELLGIIAPKNDIVDKIWSRIINTEFSDIAVLQKGGEHGAFDKKTRICVATCHAVKGLEFRVLHFMDVEGLKKFKLQRNMAYTSITRAKTSLYLYHVNQISSFIEGALCSLDPPKELPSIDSVFSGKA